jgi:Family of unknown function (DUF5677)
LDTGEVALTALVDAMRARLSEAEALASTSVLTAQRDLPGLDRVVAAIHRRIRRAARAVAVLLDANYPHEATVVARSLFEDSLRVGALAQAGPGRTSLLLGWLAESTSQAERLLRLGEELDSHDRREREDALRSRRIRLEEEARRLGVRGQWRRFPNERAMAKAQGLLQEYYHYLYATQVVHGSELAFLFDPDPVGDRDHESPTAPVPMEVRAAALSLTVTSLLRAHIATAEMLGWRGSKEAQSLLDAAL